MNNSWIDSVRPDEREIVEQLTVDQGFVFLEYLRGESMEDRLQCIVEDPSVLFYLFPLLGLKADWEAVA